MLANIDDYSIIFDYAPLPVKAKSYLAIMPCHEDSDVEFAITAATDG